MGTSHTFLIDEISNKLFAYGYNEDGQLGLGDTDHRSEFEVLPDLRASDIFGISKGLYHSVLWNHEGVFSCGENLGQLGLGKAFSSESRVVKFQKIPNIDPHSVLRVTCTDESTAIVTNTDILVSGKIRFKAQIDRDSFSSVRSIKPNEVIGFEGGTNYFVMWTKDGVYGAGSNEEGQLGLGHRNVVDDFTLIKGIKPETIRNVTCGCLFAAILTTSGIFVTGGTQTGFLLTNHVHSWTPLPFDDFQDVVDMAAGGYHLVVWAKTGLFTAGEGEQGQTGRPRSQTYGLCHIEDINPNEILTLGRGAYHTILVMTDCVKTVGWNAYGQLLVPKQVTSQTAVWNTIKIPNIIDYSRIKISPYNRRQDQKKAELFFLLLCIRELCPVISPFHKSNFPLDLFKYLVQNHLQASFRLPFRIAHPELSNQSMIDKPTIKNVFEK